MADLVVHPLVRVGVHVAQPHRCFLCVYAYLSPRQQPTPQWLHTIFTSVVDVVLKLTAPSALRCDFNNLTKLGYRILKKFYSRGASRCWWSSLQCYGMRWHCLRHHVFIHCPHKMLGYYGLQVLKVEQVTFIHEPNVGDFSDLLVCFDPCVDGGGYAQDSRGIACNCGINGQLLLKAQALESFSYRQPLIFVYGLMERPVCVYSTARCNQPRLT